MDDWKAEDRPAAGDPAFLQSSTHPVLAARNVNELEHDDEHEDEHEDERRSG